MKYFRECETYAILINIENVKQTSFNFVKVSNRQLDTTVLIKFKL